MIPPPVNSRRCGITGRNWDQSLWPGGAFPTSKVLDVYVCYLRRKMEAAGEPRLLHTVRSVGYVLREDG